MRYVFSAIRFVPDPFRGEFINVGAIVGSDESSEWAVRQVQNPLRARQLDEAGSLSAVWAFIDRVGRDIDAYEEVIEGRAADGRTQPSEDWLRKMHLRSTNVVQLSPPSMLVAGSVDEAIEQVFGQLIVDPAKRAGGVTKHPALAALRHAYRDAGIADLLEGATLHAGAHRERLDFSVANGRVVQITQAWSFAVVDQESLARAVRAWGWAVREARTNGGALHAAEQTYEVPTGVDVEVVAIPPRAGARADALEDARSVFEAIEAREVALDDAPQVAQRASDLLVASHG
jgi:Protein of unknown function (DUF3037)